MKYFTDIKRLWLLPGVLALLLSACESDEVSIPTASTQAMFEYTFDLFTDPETGSVFYEVTFTNNSLNAAASHWDFGNGDTSQEENPVYTYTENGIFDVTLTVTPMADQEGLHYNHLSASERLVLVPTIFQEGFDDPGLEENFPPEGWLLIDNDGDGHNWYWDEFEGEFYILSRSWLSGTGPLTPDNWIVTPSIDLTEITGGVSLQFDVTPTANTPDYRTENYSVMVSATGTNPEDFTEVFNERLQPDMENWVWLLRDVDLSEYAGETIYIAFRHHESTDLDRIALTNIHVFQSGN